MDVLIVTTASHHGLAEQFFFPTLPADAGATVRERRLDLEGSGSYGSQTWQRGVTAKLHWVLDYMSEAEPGQPFVLSDVDIQFFDGFSTDDLLGLLDSAAVDVLFQKEDRDPSSTEVNTGFYIARNTPWVRTLIETAIELCDHAEVANDQTAINATLRQEDRGEQWDFLPFEYYARSQGFPPPDGIVLHHANFSGTIPQKVAQLGRVRRYVDGGRVDRVRAVGAETFDYARSGKLRLAVRERIRRR